MIAALEAELVTKGFIVINKDLLADAINCNTDASYAEAFHIINTALKASDVVFRAMLTLEDTMMVDTVMSLKGS